MLQEGLWVPSNPLVQGHLLLHQTEQQSSRQDQGGQEDQVDQEGLGYHHLHLCLVGLVDPFLRVVLYLRLGPFLQLPLVKIGMLLGTKLLQAATKSAYPQS